MVQANADDDNGPNRVQLPKDSKVLWHLTGGLGEGLLVLMRLPSTSLIHKLKQVGATPAGQMRPEPNRFGKASRLDPRPPSGRGNVDERRTTILRADDGLGPVKAVGVDAGDASHEQ